MAIAAKPKKTVHAKKRQAKHHRQSKHYLKSYWPYLPMLMIVGIGIAINSAWSASAVLGAKTDFTSSSLLNQTNKNRADAAQQPLVLDPQLTQAAQAKANDMLAHNYWAHNSPQGKTPWSFIAASGYQYQAAGENLAYGFNNADETITGWMNSKEHRDNLLNTTYSGVGFGVAQAPNYLGKGPETIVVAEYGKPVDAVATISFTVPNPAAVKGAQINPAELSARPVSRIQLLTGGQAAWSALAISALAGAAFAVLVLRHGLRFRKLFAEGEAYVAHHPYVDIGIVLLCTVAVLLTHVNGIIR